MKLRNKKERQAENIRKRKGKTFNAYSCRIMAKALSHFGNTIINKE